MDRFQQVRNILFIDIETASQHKHVDELTPKMHELWDKKSQYWREKEESSLEESYTERAGIYAEFGKIISIGLGYFAPNEEKDKLTFRVKGFASDNESELLTNLKEVFNQFDELNVRLCAHNGKEFDFPYLSRRMLINGLSLPECLNNSGKKPWEISHLDTMHMWRFGDYKNYTSLDTLATVFGIESSKTDLDGSKVNSVYHEEGSSKRILDYCIQDVIVTAQVYLRMHNLKILENEEIVYA